MHFGFGVLVLSDTDRTGWQEIPEAVNLKWTQCPVPLSDMIKTW
jgi:hypothetical protein